MLSIVIVTYNSDTFIGPCLDSIFNQDYKDFEVVLVDNGSKDDTLFLIKKGYPQIKLIENRRNLGAAKARNQAIKNAQGEWILSLDCDIILEKDFLRKIMQFVENSGESIGSLQPKILRNDKKTIYSCGIYLSKLRRFFDIGKEEPCSTGFNKAGHIFGACSAAALYNRRMLEEIKEDTGYFDERFFFLVEDVDLSWRAQRKGWKAFYYPEAVSYHCGNSSKTSKRMRRYFSFRNRYFMINKNESFSGKIRLFFLGFWYEAARAVYFLITDTAASRKSGILGLLF